MNVLLTLLFACGGKTDADDTAAEPATEPATEPASEASGEPSGEPTTEPSGEPSGDPTGDLYPAPANLVGTWVGPCFPSPQGDGSYNQLTFTFTETTWDLDYVANGDENCSYPFLTVNIAGDFTLEGASEVVEGAREGTFGFSTKTVTGHMAEALSVIENACGVTDTVVDTPVDITGGCMGLGAYPVADCPADYDIVLMNAEGTTLSFGARPQDNNMCTPENRPTSFEGGATVTKQ